MRILFAGTPALAIPVLQKVAHAHEVVAVLTSPDQQAGRGRGLVASPVKEAARALGLAVLQPQKLDPAAMESVRALQPQLLVVAAYGKIFRQTFLDLFPLGGINLHPSLLPRYRGPSPISAAICAGDAETGVTVQKIALKFDTGDILAQTHWPLTGTETTASLTESLAALGAALMAEVLAAYEAGTPPEPRTQREEEATYCRTLNKEDGLIDWQESAEALERKIRAYDPWPRCSTLTGKETLLLLKSHVYPDTLGGDVGRGAPGEVLSADRHHGLLVSTGRGILAVERLQLQFKKPLDWQSFINGHPSFVGTRLGARAGET
jgi:methionyl-tRNA formyltransferase